MDPIHYSCHLQETRSPVIPDLDADEYILDFSIQTRSARMNQNAGFLQSITVDPNPGTSSISIPRLTLLSQSGQGLSLVLNYLMLPVEEHRKLVAQIRAFAASIDGSDDLDFDPDLEMMGIRVEIGIWRIANLNPNVEGCEAESEDCSICIEKLSVGSRATELACHHRFHLSCILEWLSVHPVCPICRSEVEVEQ